MPYETVVRRYREEELKQAIKDLEHRGYVQASDIVPLNNYTKDFHFKERHGSQYLYKGTHTSSKGYQVKMIKDDQNETS